MNEMISFQNTEFGELGVLEENGKFFFPATACAKMLGYKEPEKAIRVHCKGVSKMDTPTKGGVQKVRFIPEGDLYRLIVHSRLPGAERFERWVFDDVLPTIRKTGSYSTKPTITIDPDALALIVSTTMTETAKQLVPLVKDLIMEARANMQTPVLIEAPKKARERNPVLLKDFEMVLRKVMQEQRVSGNEVARRMNVGESTVSNWKNGKNQPNKKNYMRFVLEFDVPLSNLGKGVF